MPVHDWSLVDAGIFHDFHCAWITELRNVLNGGVLPDDFYALAEQFAGSMIPDVLTLRSTDTNGMTSEDDRPLGGGTAVALAPPRVRFTAKSPMDEYVSKQKSLAIRHVSDDRIIALIEIVSPGNKASRHALRQFVEKAAIALARGYHLLLIDLNPPGLRDPNGIHGVLWSELSDVPYEAPDGEPLTLAAYAAGRPTTAYIEPIAVGGTLPEMPLFLDPETYVSVPLEPTYQAAWRGLPRRWRDVLEPPESA